MKSVTSSFPSLDKKECATYSQFSSSQRSITHSERSYSTSSTTARRLSMYFFFNLFCILQFTNFYFYFFQVWASPFARKEKAHITIIEAGRHYIYDLVNIIWHRYKSAFQIQQKSSEFTKGEHGRTAAFIVLKQEVPWGLQDSYVVNVAAGFDTGMKVTSTK